jgi:hypothetical protein
MKVCGYKVKVVQVLPFELSNQRGEVCDGIDGLAINVKLGGRYLRGLENFTGLGGTDAGGDPDRQVSMRLSKLGCKLFARFATTEDKNRLGEWRLMVGDRKAQWNRTSDNQNKHKARQTQKSLRFVLEIKQP